MQEQYAVVGWKNIWRTFFFTKDGKPMLSLRTLQSYRDEMFRAGVLSKMQFEPGEPCQVFTFPSLMMAWISTKISRGELFPR